MTNHILLAEQDREAAKLLQARLEREGYTVFEADNAAEALKLIGENGVDMAILEISMFGEDVCPRVQYIQGKTRLPSLLLSEKKPNCDKMQMLRILPEHFLVRPFSPEDILERVHAAFHGYEKEEEQKKFPHAIELRDLTLSLSENRLRKRDKVISLTRMEYNILLQLMMSPGKIFSKAELYENIFGICFKSDENTIMVHISNLREKIEDNPRRPQYVLTVRGKGYKVEQ